MVLGLQSDMKKFPFLIAALLVCTVSFAQFTTTIQWYDGGGTHRGDTIYYNPDQKLRWDDFRGRSGQNSMAAAITESGFGYRMSMQSTNGRTQVVIIVYCYFNKRNSWFRKNMNTDYALTHEQHHFDITWINTCLFVKKLKAAKLTTGNYSAVVDSIYDECYDSLDSMQDEYDGQTSNGRIRKVQGAWNRKIDKMLAELVIN